ncbi:MAG: efflux RND transporter periplasmic adaptor subunit [Cyclobacteriaceae bacterium]
MKTVKKFSGILIFIVLLSLVILKLIANKKDQSKALQAILDYSYTIPVEVVLADYGTTQVKLIENGITRPDVQIDLLSETQGEVVAVHCKVGDKVAKGYVLVEIEKDVLQSQLQLARENLKNAARDLERYQKLAVSDAITQQQLESMQLNHQNALTNFNTLQEQLSNTVIRAPISGYISARSIEPGSVINPGMPVMTINSQQQMDFAIKVAERDISHIKAGQDVSVIIDVLSEQTFAGRVKEISVNADLSGRYSVLVQLLNPSPAILPGMTGTAVFKFSSEKQQIVLPRRAIMGSVQAARVYIVQGDSTIERKVDVLPINPTEVAVIQGLQPGELVVLTGHVNLQSGTPVNIINQ